PRVLELSTHGFFLRKKQANPEDEERVRPVNPGFGMGQGLGRLRVVDDPLLRSAVVLAGANRLGEDPPGDASLDDGWLTAGEITEMDLRGTELVVLSACESGVGDVRTGEESRACAGRFCTRGLGPW